MTLEEFRVEMATYRHVADAQANNLKDPLITALPALRTLVIRLGCSGEPGAPYELKKVESVIARLESKVGQRKKMQTLHSAKARLQS